MNTITANISAVQQSVTATIIHNCETVKANIASNNFNVAAMIQDNVTVIVPSLVLNRIEDLENANFVCTNNINW